RLERIDDDALRLDGIDGEPEAEEQCLQIVFARFLDFVALDLDVIGRELAAADQSVEIETERAHVAGELLRRFLEGEEHPGLAELGCAAHQKLDAEEGLPATGRAADERKPAPRQAAVGDFVEAFDSGGRLVQRHWSAICDRPLFSHTVLAFNYCCYLILIPAGGWKSISNSRLGGACEIIRTIASADRPTTPAWIPQWRHGR